MYVSTYFVLLFTLVEEDTDNTNRVLYLIILLVLWNTVKFELFVVLAKKKTYSWKGTL